MKEFVLTVRRQFGEERNYLLLLSTFCMGLLLVRMIYSGTFEYRFMGVNLILAWIPWLLSKFAVEIPVGKLLLPKFILLFFWLLFFPNAAYMVTDLFHLPEFPSAPMWYDLIMLLSFAWCGLLLGFYSLQKIHGRFFTKRNSVANNVFLFSVFFLGGIGIYLGRYERWNSWDLFFKPVQLFNDCAIILSDRYTMLKIGSLALLFAAFLTILYYKLFSTGKQINSPK